ncbi:MAG TPA: glycosyltransferase family 4 protein [Vicinamibacterales bacterium]|nr:glycosyltransferase family 4 protein [Vicinamibacterales bacterium]
MRIGIVTHNYPPHLGGLETIVHELTRGFARRHDVIVVSTAWQGRSGVTIEDGATVHRLPAWHGAEARGVPYAMPLGPGVMRAIVALRSCDVLHAHGSLYFTTLLALVARRRRVPLFLTEHVGFVRYPSPVLNAVQQVAWAFIGAPVVRRSAKVIAYNSRVHEWIAAGFGDRTVTFISNGVDTVRFHPRSAEERRTARARLGLPEGDVLALFVGRAAQKKNLDAVLEFSAKEYGLVVCGADRTLGPDVHDLGAVPYAAMPDVFAAADFLLHAATGEGFPVSVQEAMSSGLPVTILWDEGYAGSVDRNAVVAVASLEELRQAAVRLAIAPGLREEFGCRSREYALRNWSWDSTVERHLDLFRDATREKV